MLTVLQNRVTPNGDLVFSDAPFAAFGNRGIVHRGQSIVRPYAHRNWIVCATDALGAPDTFMQSDHRYTELFFLDEVTALAAGHRPCFFCRRARASDFFDLWAEVTSRASVTRDDVDRQLHIERIRGRGTTRAKVMYSARAQTLPNGTFVHTSHGATPLLLWDDAAFPWSLTGYGAAIPRPTGSTVVLTPRTTVAVLAAGYGPAAAL